MIRRNAAERPPSAQQRLLDGTARVYAAIGSHAMTVEDILGAALVSRPTFYKCFRDKHAAITAVVRESNALLRAALDTAVATAPDAHAKIAAALDAYLDWGLHQGKLATRLYAEMALPESIAALERQRTVNLIAQLVLHEMQGLKLPPNTVQPDPLLLTAVVQAVETLGSALFRQPYSIARDRVRGHALTLLAAALPLPTTPDSRVLSG